MDLTLNTLGTPSTRSTPNSTYMRVAICTDGIFPLALGGMQRHSRKLIEGLSRFEDLDIHVLHPHIDPVFTHYDHITEHCLTGIDSDKYYLRECFKYSKQVAGCLEEIRPDVIYSQGLSVWSNINNFKDRLIINPHGLEPYQGLTSKDKLVGYPFRLIFDYVFNRASVVISLGGRLTTILESRIRNHTTGIVEIPNATEVHRDQVTATHPESFRDASQFKYRALFVGRFASNKGITVLMQAIERLNNIGTGEKFSFQLAGKGPLFESFQKKYRYNNVTFLGFVSDEELKELYNSSDLFVLPTLFEGMPTVVLEAMSYGLPIIVTDVGATAELVDHSNGYLINKGSVEALEKAFTDFSNLPDDSLYKMGCNSRIKVEERFSWKIVSKQHYELFRKLGNKKIGE